MPERTGRPMARSTTTAWAFIPTSVAPTHRPTTTNARAKDKALRANAIGINENDIQTMAHRVSNADPKRVAMRPAKIMEIKAA